MARCAIKGPGADFMMTPWVLRLIIANVAVFLLAMSNPSFLQAFVLVPAFALTRPWTLITYMFIHGGFGHLLFNMLGLYFFGPRLEHRLGGRHFLALYFFSGIMGAILSFFFTPYSPIIGASGAIFGVFLAFARYWPREKIYIYGLLPIEARLFVGIMTALSIFSGLSGTGGGVAHFAHLGGFLGGFLYLRWMEWSSPAARFKRKAGAPSVKSGDAGRWSRIRREDLHPVNREELDRVITKLREMGPASLSNDERAFLNRFSPE
jgi:membrane associated rhomboid family serine protease